MSITACYLRDSCDIDLKFAPNIFRTSSNVSRTFPALLISATHLMILAAGFWPGNCFCIRVQLEESYEAKEFDPWVNAAPEPVQTQHLLAHSIEAFMQTRSNLSLQSITKYCSVLGQFQRFLGADYCVSDIKLSDVSSLKPRILPGSPFIPLLSRGKLEPRDR